MLPYITVVPNLFGTRDWFCGRQFFHGLGRRFGFRMIEAHHTYCTLNFYYYISSSSDHQALDPGDWGPLTYSIKILFYMLFSFLVFLSFKVIHAHCNQ